MVRLARKGWSPVEGSRRSTSPTCVNVLLASIVVLVLLPASSAQGDQNSTTPCACATMNINETGPAKRLDVWPNNTKDCLVHTRVSQRPFPGDCYSHEVDDWREDDWYKFLNEIMGDFRYTFDFILYDVEHPNAKHTQFWYLINYLKQLAIFIENPQEIIQAMKTLKELTTKIDNMEKEIVRKIVRALIQI